MKSIGGRIGQAVALTLIGYVLPVLGQGTLDPPTNAFSAGVPVATMKTIDQVEPRSIITHLPFDIAEPGSYYLVRSMEGSAGSPGINIASGDVKLDLNGFSINGVSNSLDGIYVSAQCNNITIRNGAIRKWGGYGICATNAKDVVIEDVQTMANDWGGIYVGDNSRIERCTVFKNGFNSPTNPPLEMPPVDDGIQAGEYCTIKDCKVRENAGAGIHTYDHATIIGCTSTESQNAEGIHTENYCTVKDCVLARNMVGGIKVTSKCRVVGNTCGENGIFGGPQGAGIFVAGDNNLIENNNVTGNYFGVRVDTAGRGNLIIRNCASNNTNDFQWSSMDFIGEIIVPTAGQFSNGGPWANFRFF